MELLRNAPEVKLAALFSPEHGSRASWMCEDRQRQRSASGLPIFSLYGETRKPTKESLQGLDTLVYDIRISARAFTRTLRQMALAMKPPPSTGCVSLCSIVPIPSMALMWMGPYWMPARIVCRLS